MNMPDLQGGIALPAIRRFVLESEDGVQQIRILPPRKWYLILQISLGLVGWLVGFGFVVMIATRDAGVPAIIFMLIWGGMGIYLAALLTWQMVGTETIRVVRGELEIRYRSPGFGKTWLYPASQITNVAIALQSNLADRYGQLQYAARPHIAAGRFGAVSFDLGSRTIFIATYADRADGPYIVSWLQAQLLPAGSASGPGANSGHAVVR